MTNGSDLVIYPVPSLVSTLLNRERAKGSPLTVEEVLDLAETAPCIAMPADVAAQMDETRAYQDIDPERCWEEWRRVRLDLLQV